MGKNEFFLLSYRCFVIVPSSERFVPRLGIKSKPNVTYAEVGSVNRRATAVAFAGVLFIFSVLAGTTVFMGALQTINPAAAIVAVTVAVIGFVWFRKSSK